ncbi:hypothetical protein I7I50_05622 [Histoplasma capsulatum G186AR]|uniref:Uncharacterized protein n=1 Tax=Ajellomyces capsulatus TaxID=5037 RepID=A0A8H7ZA09_AJECA|nr:hypothetical protein I7I52_03882 [Histoplasma capsulatum]QSS76237.1 hypothetical protein I7I50_05622 [Histoplasma capsulatum G186AR]
MSGPPNLETRFICFASGCTLTEKVQNKLKRITALLQLSAKSSSDRSMVVLGWFRAAVSSIQLL